ncbi:MAG: type VI secretion system lipoprotein TssJ [Salinibacter sp.]|uniref:type VI secretion system lipoprotein TssJ n=1 Tax=Salinibacter sp. TaxID=2065818 RepID=UPI0035D48858
MSFLLVAFLATGCSTTIEVMMSGKPDMNSGGNAAVVQVYELSGEGSFQDLSFRTFWQEKGALGKLVSSPQRKTVYPNETTTFELEVAKKTKLIGVAANLRNPDSDKWRALYSVEEVGDRLSVTVYDNRISVAVEGKGLLDKVGL